MKQIDLSLDSFEIDAQGVRVVFKNITTLSYFELQGARNLPARLEVITRYCTKIDALGQDGEKVKPEQLSRLPAGMLAEVIEDFRKNAFEVANGGPLNPEEEEAGKSESSSADSSDQDS